MPAQQKKANKSNNKEQQKKSNKSNNKEQQKKKNGNNDSSSSDSNNNKPMKGPSYPPETAPVKQRIPPKYDAEKRQKEKEKEKEEKEKQKEQQNEEEQNEEEGGGKKKEKKCDQKERDKKALEAELKRLLSRKSKEEQALENINNKANKGPGKEDPLMQMSECRPLLNMCDGGGGSPKFSPKEDNSLKPMGIGRNIHLHDSVIHDMKLNVPEPPRPPSQDAASIFIDEVNLPEPLRKEAEKKREAAKKVAPTISFRSLFSIQLTSISTNDESEHEKYTPDFRPA